MEAWLAALDNIDWRTLALQWGGRVIAVLLILFVGMIMIKWVARAAERGMTRAKLEPTVVQFLRKVAYISLLVLLLVVLLQVIGVPMASMVAVLAAAGLAIGFALKDSLSNIASGVMLVTLRPFKVGDLVTINNLTGTVESVSIFLTCLRGADNQTIIFPNSVITSDSIINLTPDVMRRIEIVLGISYGDDIDNARAEALRVMRADERVLAEPEPSVVVYDLANDRVTLGLRCHTNNADNFSTKCDLKERLTRAFDAAGISIPNPQRDVHLFHHAADDQKITNQGAARAIAAPESAPGSAAT